MLSQVVVQAEALAEKTTETWVQKMWRGLFPHKNVGTLFSGGARKMGWGVTT